MDEYLNDALKILPKNELFCIMDDDDFYTSNTALAEAVGHLGEGDVVFFRVRAACGSVPTITAMTAENKALVFGNVSMLGFIMKTDLPYSEGKLIKFKAQHGGDFEFINDVIECNYETKYNDSNIKWCFKTLASTNSANDREGEGKQKDVEYEAALQGYRRDSKCGY